MESVLRVMVVLGLWFLELVVLIIALPYAILRSPFDKGQYASNLAKAVNRAAAAAFGWSGEHGVSHECGTSACRFCRILCEILSVILLDKNHCQKEADK